MCRLSSDPRIRGAAPRFGAENVSSTFFPRFLVKAVPALFIYLRTAMQTILVLNGPNLNLLGEREPSTYGIDTLDDVRRLCALACTSHGYTLEFAQSNHEGELVEHLHAAGKAQAQGTLIGVVLNAGAYTHTSIALHDAIKGAAVTVIELHISNIFAREAFRHHSYISAVARGVLAGFGTDGYAMAIDALVHIESARQRRRSIDH